MLATLAEYFLKIRRAARPGWLALALVTVASLRIISTYTVLSHTTDEPAHLAAGIEWLENGTYTYEDQHPPLARVAGALGAHVAGSRWSRDPEMYAEGYHLLGQNKRYNRVLYFSRLFMLPFFWVACAAIYCWGFRMGGGWLALLAILLFTTSPPILAHAGLATTDMAVTAFVTAALVASLSFADRPGLWRSLLLGVLVGLAMLSKFSALLFLPAAWILMIAGSLLIRWPGFRRLVTPIPWLILSLAVCLAVVWAGYRFSTGPVAFLHLELPAPAFFTGIRYVYLHNKEGHLAYLLGRTSQKGFWYYYPVVLAVKTPLATLILAGIAIGLVIRRRMNILMPASLLLALLGIGFFSHINIGVRHILPAYAALALIAAAGLDVLLHSRQTWVWRVGVMLMAWQIVSGVVEQPDYLAYTNELAGRHPERILADSDLDWDQGMRGLALRLQQLGVHHFTFKPNSAGYMIAEGHSFPGYDQMPDGDTPQPGWNAVCVTAWKQSGEPKWADRTEPLERIHRSIYLYYFPPVK